VKGDKVWLIKKRLNHDERRKGSQPLAHSGMFRAFENEILSREHMNENFQNSFAQASRGKQSPSAQRHLRAHNFLLRIQFSVDVTVGQP
jgi:hypothetical protein